MYLFEKVMSAVILRKQSVDCWCHQESYNRSGIVKIHTMGIARNKNVKNFFESNKNNTERKHNILNYKKKFGSVFEDWRFPKGCYSKRPLLIKRHRCT